MADRVANLTNIRLEDFTPGMTMYIMQGRKDEPPRTYYCRFVRMDHGVVVAETISSSCDYGRKHSPEVIRCRKSKVFLWGVPNEGENRRRYWPRCHWYDKELGWK